MREIKLSDKYTLKIARASFKDAHRLKDLVLKSINFKSLGLDSINTDKLLETELTSDLMASLMGAFVDIEADENILDQVLKCSSRSLINGEKITEELLEDDDFWPFVLEFKLEVIKVNVFPFLRGLPSTLGKVIEQVSQA